MGGVALAALKRYKAAEDFFAICASAPVGGSFTAVMRGPQVGGTFRFSGNEPSGIQMDAIKKLLLVQLIQYGKVRPIGPAGICAPLE